MIRERHVFGAILLLLVAWPFFAGDYAVTQANRAMIYGLAVLSFSILAGRLGLFSMCQVTFAGIAAYTIAILQVRYGVAVPWAVLTAVAVSVVAAALFAAVTLRSTGVGFLMLTLALGQMVWALGFQWVDLTGGYNGIAGVRLPTIGGVDFGDDRVFYAMLALVTVAIFLLVHRLYESPFGLLLTGVQENERRMRALGQPVLLARFVTFVLAGFIAGLAGVFLVYDLGIMSPAPLDLGHAVWVLTAAVIGGYRSIWGPVLGVIVLVTLEVVVRQYTDRHMMVIGLVLLLSILLMPNGLSAFLRQLFAKHPEPSASATTPIGDPREESKK